MTADADNEQITHNQWVRGIAQKRFLMHSLGTCKSLVFF